MYLIVSGESSLDRSMGDKRGPPHDNKPPSIGGDQRKEPPKSPAPPAPCLSSPSLSSPVPGPPPPGAVPHPYPYGYPPPGYPPQLYPGIHPFAAAAMAGYPAHPYMPYGVPSPQDGKALEMLQQHASQYYNR